MGADDDRSTALADRGAGATRRSLAQQDRSTALLDRDASADERTEAGLDRSTALIDREDSADERTKAGLDRSTAHADRGAAARDREQATADDLTGVYRRGAGLSELGREVSRAARTAKPLVVAFVDVDHLKAVNDEHGHAAGDRLLQRVAGSLTTALRTYDLVIRYGGDEFVCVLEGLTLAGARRRMARVTDALALGPDPQSVSIGLAQLQPHELPAELVARADGAMYDDRQRRRGQPAPAI